MNKKILLTTALVSLFAINVQASDFSPYVSGRIKALETITSAKGTDGWNADFTDTTFAGAVALGVSSGNIRGELEYNFQDSAVEKEDMGCKSGISSFMLNAYYDFKNSSKFTPYVGLGLGVANIKLKDIEGSFSESSAEIAYQIGFGVSYSVSSNFVVDAGYRFVDNGELSFSLEDDKYKLDYQSNEFYLGARYQF